MKKCNMGHMHDKKELKHEMAEVKHLEKMMPKKHKKGK